jgi:hypothetical protein
LCGAALVAAGFADYSMIAYHFGRTGAVAGEWIAIFYAVAMTVSGPRFTRPAALYPACRWYAGLKRRRRE